MPVSTSTTSRLEPVESKYVQLTTLRPRYKASSIRKKEMSGRGNSVYGYNAQFVIQIQEIKNSDCKCKQFRFQKFLQ
jgi:hypothetical protein